MAVPKYVLDASTALVLFALADKGQLIKPDLGYSAHVAPSLLDNILASLSQARLVDVADGSTGVVRITDAGREARNLIAHGIRPPLAISGDLPDSEEIDQRLREVLGG